MNSIIEKIANLKIVPVVVLNDVNDALPLAKALIDGGLPVAEVTFRTDAAKESIRLMCEHYPNMLVGAGTVLTTKQVDDAIEAGAKFIVSPGLNPRIVRYCNEKNILIIPGCSNASDIEQALENDINVIKFFPAELAGGLPMIKALAAPYVNVRFMPTGGVNQNNIKDYLSFNRVVACGGTWMVNNKLIENKDFKEITRLTKEAVEMVK